MKLISVALTWIGISGVMGAPMPGVDISPFGSHTSWPSDSRSPHIGTRNHQAGVDLCRIVLGDWSKIEISLGSYTFNSPSWNTDWAIDLLEERGIEPYALLVGPHPSYSHTTAAGRTAYANFCGALAAHHADRVDYYEIWNEPNTSLFWGSTPNPGTYTLMAIEAAAAIRANDPDARIAGGATAGIDLTFLESCFQAGLLDAVDIVSVHPYRIDKPESIAGEIAVLQSLITTYAPASREITIWTGEWGYNSHWSEVSETGQAKCLSRMMVNSLSLGIEASLWFTSQAFTEADSTGRDPEWAFLDWGAWPRDAFHALRVVNEHLASPVSEVGDPLNVTMTPSANRRARTFERGTLGHRTIAVWYESWPLLSDTFPGYLTSLSFDASPESVVRAFNGLTGDEIPITVSHGAGRAALSNLSVPDYPIFIQIDDPGFHLNQIPEGWNLAGTAVTGQASSGDPLLAADGLVLSDSIWVSEASPEDHWIALDLGDEFLLTGSIVHFASAAGASQELNAASAEFQIADSMSGPWITLATADNSSHEEAAAVQFVGDQIARFVRLLVTDSDSDSRARVAEFEVIGDQLIPPMPAGNNLALGTVAHATDSDYSVSYGGDKAYDGVVSLTSKWTSTSASSTHWLALDLGDVYRLNGTVLELAGQAESGHYNLINVEIQTGESLSGPWITQASEFNTLQRDRIITSFDAPVDARFVRVYVTNSGVDLYCRLPEFEVYGTNPVPAELSGFMVN